MPGAVLSTGQSSKKAVKLPEREAFLGEEFKVYLLIIITRVCHCLSSLTDPVLHFILFIGFDSKIFFFKEFYC